MEHTSTCDCGAKIVPHDRYDRTITCKLCQRTYSCYAETTGVFLGFKCSHCRRIVDKVYSLPQLTHWAHAIRAPNTICSNCIKDVTKDIGELYSTLQKICMIDSI